MWLASKGSQRDKGRTIHFTDVDYTVIGSDATCVRVKIGGKRRYELTLTAEEVIECLLALPSGKIADAVSGVGSAGRTGRRGRGLLSNIPEVLKQLADGAMASSSARSE
jgi:hypothetical protein